MENKSIDQARALYYKFFGIALDFVHKEEQINDLAELILLFGQSPVDENLTRTIQNMQEFITNGGLEALNNENNKIFISPDTSYIPMSASYYDEGRDDGAKRVECASYVFSSKFRKNEINCSDSEDNLVFVFQFMQTLIQAGVEGDNESLILSRKIFENILNDCLDELANMIYMHESGNFYKNVAVLLKTFIDFERFYLGVNPSNRKISKERVSHVIQKDRKPLTKKIRRNLDEINL